jgi:hypothetical protein
MGKLIHTGCWLLSAIVLAHGAAAYAGSVEDAKALFLEGIRLVQAGKAEEACPKFAESHRLDPSFGALFNLADCHQRTGLSAAAYNEFRAAETLAAREDQPARAQKASRRWRRLEADVVVLTVAVAAPVADLRVSVDGEEITPELWGAFALATGSHAIAAVAPHRLPWREQLDAPAPAAVTVRIPELALPPPEPPAQLPPSPRLEPTATPPPLPAPTSELPPPRPVPPQPLGTRKTIAATLAGVGGLSLLLGTATGVATFATWHSVTRGAHCDQTLACDAEGVRLAAQAQSLSYVSTTSFVVAAASAATSLGLWLSDKRPVQRARVSIRVAPGSGSLSVEY